MISNLDLSRALERVQWVVEDVNTYGSFKHQENHIAKNEDMVAPPQVLDVTYMKRLDFIIAATTYIVAVDNFFRWCMKLLLMIAVIQDGRTTAPVPILKSLIR